MGNSRLRATLLFSLLAGLLALQLNSPAWASVDQTPTASTYPTFNKAVRVVAHAGSTVFVGGDFTRVTNANGRTFVRRGAAAFNADTGAVLRWNPNVKGSVYAIAIKGKAAFLGGKFSRVKGKVRHNLARVSRGGAAKLTVKFARGTNAPVWALAFSKKRLLVGGDFSRVQKKARTHAAAIKLAAPYAITPWAPATRIGGVRALQPAAEGIYLGGDFRQFGNRTNYHRLVLVNAVSAKLVTRFNPKVPFMVFDLARSNSSVYAAVGGAGNDVWSITRRAGVREWRRFTDGDVQAVELYGGELYIGGHFNRICAVESPSYAGCNAATEVRQRAASLDTNGNLTAWDPNGNSSWGVWDIDGLGARGLAVGGDFTAWAGTPAGRFSIFPQTP
jgi:hypothetical protein